VLIGGKARMREDEIRRVLAAVGGDLIERPNKRPIQAIAANNSDHRRESRHRDRVDLPVGTVVMDHPRDDEYVGREDSGNAGARPPGPGVAFSAWTYEGGRESDAKSLSRAAASPTRRTVRVSQRQFVLRPAQREQSGVTR
jgi:hypothetical protein